jgi:hypothetical protein
MCEEDCSEYTIEIKDKTDNYYKRLEIHLVVNSLTLLRSDIDDLLELTDIDFNINFSTSRIPDKIVIILSIEDIFDNLTR